MYIIKNAFRTIGRSKGRNALIGIIVLVISVAACIGLSIRQASESAREDTLSGMSVSATISFDRQAMMGDMTSGGFGGSFDKDSFAEMMGSASALTLEEYQKYAEAESVKDFYYTLTSSFNGSADIEPVSKEGSSSSESPGGFEGNFGGSFGGGMPNMMNSGEFSVTGYSSEASMLSFINGTAKISDGVVFEEGEASYECIISEELAVYNELEVGDSITLSNPDNENETYGLKIVGIYSDSSSNEGFAMMRGSDPANNIYVSYNTLADIVSLSEESAKDTTDGDEVSAIKGSLNATYSFENANKYYRFEEEVRDMGLSDKYSVSSTDLTSFENSLVPLDTLSTMAGWFLVVILVIGGIILVVLNIFSIRERKYEIGVLMAVGMKKGKIAAQFLTEVFVVALSSVFIGICIGALSSVPVTNALLENQIASSSAQAGQIEENFGRGDMPDMGNMPNMGGMQMPGGGRFDAIGNIFGDSAANYINEIDTAMNLTVVLEMLIIAILLTLTAGAVSILFIMRYEPLKILSNRD